MSFFFRNLHKSCRGASHIRQEKYFLIHFSYNRTCQVHYSVIVILPHRISGVSASARLNGCRDVRPQHSRVTWPNSCGDTGSSTFLIIVDSNLVNDMIYLFLRNGGDGTPAFNAIIRDIAVSYPL